MWKDFVFRRRRSGKKYGNEIGRAPATKGGFDFLAFPSFG